MKWTIKDYNYKKMDVKDTRYPYLKARDFAGIKFNPENNPMEYFLMGISIFEYPNFLNSFNNNSEFYSPPGCLKFYSHLDWEDLEELKYLGPVKTTDIYVYHENGGDSIINEFLVSEIVRDYSQHLFNNIDNVYVNFNSKWKDQFTRELNSLKKSILKLEEE